MAIMYTDKDAQRAHEERMREIDSMPANTYDELLHKAKQRCDVSWDLRHRQVLMKEVEDNG